MEFRSSIHAFEFEIASRLNGMTSAPRQAESPDEHHDDERSRYRDEPVRGERHGQVMEPRRPEERGRHEGDHEDGDRHGVLAVRWVEPLRL